MAQYCISCGAALKGGARFCGECGAPVLDDNQTDTQAHPAVSAIPLIVPPATNEMPIPDGDELPAEQSSERKINWLLVGGSAAILFLLLFYYWVFIRDDMAETAPAPKAEKVAAQVIEDVQLYAAAQANIRNRSTTVGTTVIGKLARGIAVTGQIVTGEDGSTPWLKLADDKGFVATSNLSEEEPPEIVKALGDRLWTADKALVLLAKPDASAPVLENISAGVALSLFGLTGNDFIEIKRKKGGVGYIADGARIVEASSVKGPPIAISFNPASCNFGGELEAQFGKLNAKSRAAYKAIDQTEFASDAARDKALVAFEGKSYYQRLERSFNGLSITGIAQHYESQSIYFADPPNKVLAAFRGVGHKIRADGQFTNTEIYAGIGATAGEGRGYGKTDLSCGV